MRTIRASGLQTQYENSSCLVLVGELVSVSEISGGEYPRGLGCGSVDDPEIRIGVCRVSSGVAMSRSSSGKEAARLARTLSSCSGGMAASRTRRPAPGRAESAVMSSMGSAVAIMIQETYAKPTGCFLLSRTDQFLNGQMLLQAHNAGKRDEDRMK